MVDRDVVGQPRPGQSDRRRPARLAERRLEECPSLVHRGERPPAVQDADLESRAQEWVLAVGPPPVVQSRSPQLRDVVASVVVDDEEPAARPEQAGGLGDVVRSRPAECRPQPTTTSADAVGRGERRRSCRVDDRDASAERSASCRARRPADPSTTTTSRPSTGPSASIARGILPSTSRIRASCSASPVPRSMGRSATGREV